MTKVAHISVGYRRLRCLNCPAAAPRECAHVVDCYRFGQADEPIYVLLEGI